MACLRTPNPRVSRATRLATVLALAAAVWAPCARAAPRGGFDACFVRPADATASSAATGIAPSHVGIRRKTEQLFELDVSVSAGDLDTCQVGGTARLRGEAGAEVLGMVVRPDPSRKTGRSGTLCQLFVRLTPAGLELKTTPGACQAQALCEGKVELDGQRFEAASRLPAGAQGPCFAKAAP